MFRDDREALALQNQELQRELERLRREHAAMRRALVAIQRGDHPEIVPSPATLYTGDLSGLPEGLRAAYAAHRLTPTPLWRLALLHVLTLGISSLVHFARMSEQLPRLAVDDPPAFKAALGFFIPYYNFYWLFAFPLRLADRINLQFRLRGRAPAASRGLLITTAVLSIPLYFLFPLFWLFPALQVQRAVNELCALPTSDEPEGEGAAYTGVRVVPGAEDHSPAGVEDDALDAALERSDPARSGRSSS